MTDGPPENCLNSNSDQALGIRIAAVVRLYPTKKAASESAEVRVNQLQRYEKGMNIPAFDILVRLAKPHRVNLHWLATGEGPMRIADGLGPVLESQGPAPGPVTAPAVATDGRLMGRLTEGIMRVFKEMGQAAAVRSVVERAAIYHDRIILESSDPEDRAMRAGELLAELRAELRAAATAPNQIKHSV